jgi:hypothetical protein
MVIQAFPALPNLVNAEKQGTGLLALFFATDRALHSAWSPCKLSFPRLSIVIKVCYRLKEIIQVRPVYIQLVIKSKLPFINDDG